MFMLRNASKYLFGNPQSKESIIEIPQGQLYLVRPLSPKGYSELIFRDATCSIRRTGQQFQYQLVVQRVYEEGEEELDADEEGEDGAIASLEAEKDEKTFLLDEDLYFRIDSRPGGENVFGWRDLSGDPGDLFEFVCDNSVQASAITSFQVAAVQCQYERKYRKSGDEATEEELEQFSFDGQPIPDSGASPTRNSPTTSPNPSSSRRRGRETEASRSSAMAPSTPLKGAGAPVVAKKALQTIAPKSAKHPEKRETLADEVAELHLFDLDSGNFILQDAKVQATVFEVGGWNYWLQITGDDRDWLGQAVVADLNPVFNFEYLSFIFNHYTEDGSAYSWLLRFNSQGIEERFQAGLMQALWEHLNQSKWTKVKDDEREYVLDAFNDLTMEDIDAKDQEADEEEDDDDEADDDDQKSEHYDSDESQDDVALKDEDGNMNSQLAVGFKNDRSFVVRGSKIGVFKNTPQSVEFSTNISKVQTPKGKLFSPKKVMLHAEDRDMILQNKDNPNSLYRMDLEYGKVVDEWKVHDDIPVKTFAPEKKYAQMTSEPTLLGLSSNALYRIDPRLSGSKLVDSQLKQYASKNEFSAAATTANGYIAVASEKGDVRMFDRLGIIAKTHIPALGESITGLDVSAEGRWILATTRTYLLLIDALQHEGKNAGKLGFEKAFGKDSKPQPRRLGLSPSHVAQFMHETKAGIAFTPARFNTGIDNKETTIVTATGPYVITWSMKKFLAGQRDPYNIKRYEEQVKADDFRYGTDKNMIVALPNAVGMVKKGELKRPTRESIAGTPVKGGRGMQLRSTPRRSGRASHLSRSEVVDSPY